MQEHAGPLPEAQEVLAKPYNNAVVCGSSASLPCLAFLELPSHDLANLAFFPDLFPAQASERFSNPKAGQMLPNTPCAGVLDEANEEEGPIPH